MVVDTPPHHHHHHPLASHQLVPHKQFPAHFRTTGGGMTSQHKNTLLLQQNTHIYSLYIYIYCFYFFFKQKSHRTNNSLKISSTSSNKRRPRASQCCDPPINHPRAPCCELISSLTAFHVRACVRARVCVCVFECGAWALQLCQINASSEPCPARAASSLQK